VAQVPTRPATRSAARRAAPLRPAWAAAKARISPTALATIAAVGLVPIAILWWVDTTSVSGMADVFLAVGRLTGFLCGYTMLLLLVLVARIPAIEDGVGTDRLITWHAFCGRYTTSLLVVHGVGIIASYAMTDHRNPLAETWSTVTQSAALVGVTAGSVLLAVLMALAMRRVRPRLPYEVWHAIHLLTYAVIVTSILHQIYDGSSFQVHPVARVLWAAAYGLALVALVWYRVVVPLRRARRHQLHVLGVRDEAPGVVSVYIGGRHLDQLAAAPGQFFRWRFAGRGLAANPYSLSAAPNNEWLRITVRALGGHSAALRTLVPGTRVYAEGPYGAITPHVLRSRHILLIAGGVGVAQIRALAEAIPPGCDATVLYRAHDSADLILVDELRELARDRGIKLLVAVGPRESVPAAFTPRGLLDAAPAVARSTVVVCGPPSMTQVAVAAARGAGTPKRNIYAESFSW
jgi:predicted ferric reductase